MASENSPGVQSSLVTTSETGGRGKFRFGHFEASNPDETQGGGLLGENGRGREPGNHLGGSWGNITDIQHVQLPWE